MTGAEIECLHPNQEIRWRKDAIGRVVVLGQCLDCGIATTQFLKKELLPAGASEWDASWDTRRTEAFEAERMSREIDFSKAREEHAERYREYLKTDGWRRKRDHILRRDEYLCQGCLSRPATQVHHLTYEHIFEEFALELVSLCGHCHARIHGKEAPHA
jgi:hypothetical protein